MINNSQYTIEHYLGLLASSQCTVNPDTVDIAIINSIARQTSRGLALTDRQYHLMLQKLSKYREQFIEQGYTTFDQDITQLAFPIRTIDRSKTISVIGVDEGDHLPMAMQDAKRLIKIRFPFNKKTIAALEKIASQYRNKHYHKNGSVEHYFVLDELVVLSLVTAFKDRNFQIDQLLIDIANQVAQIKSNPVEYLPCISNGKTYNIRDTVKSKIKSEVGNSVVKLIDRHRRYGLVNFDTVPGCGLESDIVNRPQAAHLVNPNTYTTKQVFGALHNLDRYPILVILNERTAEGEMLDVWETVNTLVDSQYQSVLFRQEGDTPFNRFVKEKNLNNWVDTDTKIVYVSSNKLPKILITSDWQPITAFKYLDRSLNRYNDVYLQSKCDLIISYDTEKSLMRKHSSYYSW